MRIAELQHWGALLLVLALCLPAGAAQAPAGRRPDPGPEKISPQRIRPSVPGKPSATQFLAVDLKGRTYLLRGDTLEVFRLAAAEGELRSLGRLACRRSPEGAYAAAMDASASRWAVSSSPFDLALCDFKEETKPSGWSGLISSLAYSRTSPLVAVVPYGGGLDAAESLDRLRPRVFELDRSRWKPVYSIPLPDIGKNAVHGRMTQLKAETDSLLCADSMGALWLGSWNAYRLQKVSSGAEKPETELTVGNAEIAWSDFGAEEKKAIDASVKRSGLDPAKNQGGKARPRNVIRAMLCGPGRAIHLLVSTGEGLALDRFDPALRSLERIQLAGVEVGAGPMTAAMNAADLVFGGRLGEDGLWRIALADLETARWKPVPGARLDGKPL